MSRPKTSAILDAANSLLILSEVGSGRVVSMNRAAEELTGFTRDQAIGLPLWELASPERQDMLRRVTGHPIGQTESASFESTISSSSGAPRRIAWSSTFLTDETGVRSHVLLTGVDLSSEAASSGLFAHLMHAANSTALVSTDLRGRVTYCSSGAERMLGVVGAALMGEPLPMSMFDPSEIRLRARDLGIPENLRVLMMADATHGPSSRSADLLAQRDWTLVCAGGSRIIASLAISVARDADGNPVGYVGVAHDVTERRMANDVLKEALASQVMAVERLEELNRARVGMVATLSHELRTPLTCIMGSTELLEDGLGDSASGAQRALIDVIVRNSERLRRLADDVATLDRADVGELKMELTELDLRDVVSSARDSLQTLLVDRLLDLFAEMPAEPVVVRGDAAHLTRAVVNLLSNAIKFTDDGGSILCRLTTAQSEAVLEVSDTGIGIPRVEQRDLFTQFFHSSTSLERASQGPGLGLSIVSSIVHGHGGQISVDSEHLQGCAFTVRIPLAARLPIAGTERLLLASELRLALAEPITQLILHYEPIVDLTSGSVVAVESHVCWQHPVRGLLGPDHFIRLAQDHDLIDRLGDWVLDQSIRDAPDLTDEGRTLDIAVDFSLRQLNEHAVAKVRAAIEHEGLDPARLVIKVMESAVVEDETTTAATLEALSRLGVRIALTDFGSGCSSVSHLLRHPVSALKIDPAIVAGIGKNQDDEAICASIITLAASVGATSVGDGVETSEQCTVLRSLGCLQGQGLLWSPAVPLDGLAAALTACAEVQVAGPQAQRVRTADVANSLVGAPGRRRSR